MSPLPLLNIVVIGASAGGVEALRTLFSALPPQVDAAILVVLHQGQASKSRLAAILQRCTTMDVRDAVDGERLEHGRVYIATSGHQMTIDAECVRVLASPKEGSYRPCIDTLFRSASTSHGIKVIGIVLSGTLRDGTAGVRHIASTGGATVVQEPDEAECSGMPLSAIAGMHIQHRLPLREIAELIAAIPAIPAA